MGLHVVHDVSHPGVAHPRLGRERRIAGKDLVADRWQAFPRSVAEAGQEGFVRLGRAVDEQALDRDDPYRWRIAPRQRTRRAGQGRVNGWRCRRVGGGERREAAPQRIHAAARGRDDRVDRRPAEMGRQPVGIDPHAGRLGRVSHRQRNGHGQTELDELLREVESLVEIARVHDTQDRVGHASTLDTAEDDVDRDLFFVGMRAQAVQARQVDEFEAAVAVD